MSAPKHARKRTRRRSLGKPFSQLQACFTLASTGDGFALGAVPLLAVVVDPHPLAVSAVVTADLLPWLLMAAPAGAMADRYRRSRVMGVANLLRAVVLFGSGMLVIEHRMDLALLMLVVLVNASSRAVYYSALQASVPEIVRPESLERANGVLTGTEAAAEHVAGPIVGAATFVLARALPFFADSAAMALSSLTLVRFRTGGAQQRHALQGSVWEGARLLLADRRLRLLLFTVSSIAGLQGLVMGVLVLVATRDWGVHTGGYGVFLAAGAIGTIPGALLAERLVGRLGSALTLIASAVVLAVSYLFMAMAHTWVLAGAAFVVTGFAIGATSVVATSMRQRLTPPELMGRVGSAWRGVVWGAAPVGALAAGSLAVLGGLRLPVFLAGGLQLIVIAFLARPLLSALPRRRGPLVEPAAGPTVVEAPAVGVPVVEAPAVGVPVVEVPAVGVPVVEVPTMGAPVVDATARGYASRVRRERLGRASASSERSRG